MRILHFPPRSGTYSIYGRLAWLDELRLVAIVMMLLDHALFFFASEEVWATTIRMTLTRCAEPLFVFVFTYLAIYLGHSMRPKRWFRVAIVSVFTSWALSEFLGNPIADILASIAVVALLLPLLLKIPRAWCLAVLYVTAALAALTASIAGVAFDYSPALVAYQVLLIRLHGEGGYAGFVKHCTLSGLLLAATSMGSVALGAGLSSSVIVVLFGHPLAMVLIKVIMAKNSHFSTRLTQFAAKPLTVYATHLLAFAALAKLVS